MSYSNSCKRILVFFSLSLGLFLQAHAQEYRLRFNHITPNEGLSHSSVMGIAKDKYGFIWIATWDGLNKYDGYKIFTYLYDPHNNKTISNNRIRQIYKDREGNIWVACSDSICAKYNYYTDDFTRYNLKSVSPYIVDSLNRNSTFFHTFIQTNDFIWKVYQFNNILVKDLPLSAVDYTLTQTNRKTGHSISYKTDLLNPWALNDDYVRSIYLDNTGILWVGTYSGGVNMADLYQKKFNLIQRTMRPDSGLIDNRVRTICVDDSGQLWVGSNSRGITQINRKKQTFTYFQQNAKHPEKGIINNQIRKIYNDRLGLIWIGTKGGLSQYNPQTKIFRHYFQTTGHLQPPNWISWIMEDSNGYLWVGWWGGISKYDRRYDRFQTYTFKSLLKYPSVRCFIEDEKHNFWVASEGGLYYLKRDTSHGFEEKISINTYLNHPENANSISDNRIYAILETEDQNIWIATASGLDCLNPSTGKFYHFSSLDNLPEKMILGLVDDKRGNLWISHRGGLTKLNRQTHEIRNYHIQDGLQSNEFLEDAYFRNQKTGEVFFGGVNGLNSFYPETIEDNPFIPQTTLTELYLDSQKENISQSKHAILSKPLYLTRKISIPYTVKTFSIEFSALHYSMPINNRYAYRLHGYEESWVYTSASNRIATYSNLKAGNYIFQVKAANCDGLWNDKPVELAIVVQEPWWTTWWLKLIVLLGFMWIIYGLYKLRLRLFQRKEEELTILVKRRTHELEESNSVLLEQNTHIEEQAEELEEQKEEISTYSEKLKNLNEELMVKQEQIIMQSNELEENNRRLNVLNLTKDRFLSIIAHDLRNPFHAVSGFTEVLLTRFETLPSDKIEKYLNLIRFSAVSGSNLLENLLIWSRSQSGHIIFEPVSLNLWSLLEETESLLKGAMIQKNVTLELAITKNLIVYADENMVKTIFRNLVSNAIKFSNESGWIQVRAEETIDLVTVIISDNGVGMPSSVQEQLFRIDTSVSTKGTANETGSGLGLILCKEFVDKHGGTICVESEEGKGSQFVFTLPKPTKNF